MRKITKQEMYDAITSKHPSLKALDIDGGYKRNGILREELFKIMIEFKIHKSRHLTKEKKLMVENEIKARIIEKL